MLMERIGKYAPDFEIPGADGKVHHFATYLGQYKAAVVIFMCNHCPYVGMYLDRLKALQAEFEPQGVTLIGINANDANQFPEDSFDAMKVFARERGLNFPYLWDPTQDVADCFGAKKTPQAFLVDANSVMRYIGAVDDSPQDPSVVTQAYLRDAITSFLDEQPIAIAFTEAIGCSVKWRPGR
ncbi:MULTISPECIES: thioredoxin family protein [Limnothrix]|uniref:Thioredoxin family protein n=2 Tax=Limnothrix TaxID=132605 RepID=A0ABW7CFX6_9CYAN|nr:thioredoxin family protein [Limnothrix sp. FACHB-1083]